jgi:hypothetical protein
MKTRRATNGTATGITNNEAPAIGTSIVSLRTTNDEQTKHRTKPEPGLCRQAGAPSHDLIAERARAIWLEHGCPSGQDEENWRDAEVQLRIELGIG